MGKHSTGLDESDLSSFSMFQIFLLGRLYCDRFYYEDGIL